MVQVKTMEKENTNSLQVGAGPVKLKNVNKPLFGHYEKVHVEPKRFLTEFKVSEDAFLPVGRSCFERGRAQVSTTQACGIEVYSADILGFIGFHCIVLIRCINCIDSLHSSIAFT